MGRCKAAIEIVRFSPGNTTRKTWSKKSDELGIPGSDVVNTHLSKSVRGG